MMIIITFYILSSAGEKSEVLVKEQIVFYIIIWMCSIF